jgi:fumarylacetoacetase
MFSRAGEPRRAGVAIGDQLLDLDAAAELRLVEGESAAAARACKGANLDPILALAGPSATALRHVLSDVLASGHAAAGHASRLLVSQSDAKYYLPAAIGGFTDFFTSLFHTERGGRASRPENPVPLNFRYMPIAYNSRASSVRISGEEIRRPLGQRRRPDGEVHFGPCENLDFELELGAFVGKANELGEPVDISVAGDSCSAIVCSMTGRPVISSAGRASRSGRSSPRRFPPRSRRSSSHPMRCDRSGPLLRSVRKVIRRR